MAPQTPYTRESTDIRPFSLVDNSKMNVWSNEPEKGLMIGRPLGASCDLLFDDFNNARLCECAEISELIPFASNDLAHDTTHDLS